MKKDKLRYKVAIKEKERCNANSFSDSLNDALSSKDMDSFWRTWRSKFSDRRQPSVIDGCCNDLDIANRFAEVFESISVPNSVDKHEQLGSVFMSRFMSYKGPDVSFHFVNVSNVQKRIEDLKRGKAAGCDGLTAEHICFAHPILSVHLAYVVAMMYKHSLVRDDFGKGIIIPLLKNSDGNRFTSCLLYTSPSPRD